MLSEEHHRRRSIRLKGYDYTQPGAYFVTIVVQGRECLLGEIVDGEMWLNHAGRMVQTVWHGLPDRFPGIYLDAFAVMPNHVHGVVVIVGDGGTGVTTGGTIDVRATTSGAPDVGAALVAAPNGATTRVAPTGDAPVAAVAPTLGDIVGAFKSITTVEYTRGVKKRGWPSFPGRLWQRNYYEHIVRNEDELNRVRQYIDENPLRWDLDQENPDRKRDSHGLT